MFRHGLNNIPWRDAVKSAASFSGATVPTAYLYKLWRAAATSLGRNARIDYY